MTEMSPLSRLLMRLLRAGSWGAMGFLTFFAGILLYQRWRNGALLLQQTDYGFLAVLGALFILAVYLVRGIARELDRPGG